MRMDLLYDHLVRARATGAVFARTVGRAAVGTAAGRFDPARGAHGRPRPGIPVAGHPRQRRGALTGNRHAGARRAGPLHRARAGRRLPGAGGVPGPARPGGPGDNPQATVFLCGAYQFSGDVGSGLLDALPQVMTLSAAIDDPLRDVVTLLSRELARTEPAQQIVLDRLLDLLLVLAIRSDFRRSATAPRWYRASADPRLSAALQAMHENTARPWTVPELAAISGLSRAAFARAFREALGQAPMQYLTEWRMTLAREHLRADELSLAQIADAVGYGSPFAFAAAFRRHHRDPPGAWRQRERAAAGTHPLTTHPGS